MSRPILAARAPRTLPARLASVRLAFALAICAAAAPALAGTASAPPPQPVADGRPDPMCASFGKDFTRLPGTSTCVKISGNMQVDGYQQSLPTSDPLAPALKSR